MVISFAELWHRADCRHRKLVACVQLIFHQLWVLGGLIGLEFLRQVRLSFVQSLALAAFHNT